MFVRTKYDKQRKRHRVQIVKTYRDGDTVRQKVLRHVGSAYNKEELERLCDYGRFLAEELKQTHSAQGSLFSPTEMVDLMLKAEQTDDQEDCDVKLSECRERSRQVVGVRAVFTEMYRLLGWERLLGSRRLSDNRILRELVIARLVQPRSKRKTVLDLSRDVGVNLNLEQVYRSMDSLTETVIENIKAQSYEYARSLFRAPINVVFYDTTTLYFESEAEDELRRKGYSKDGKPHRTQVLLALLITPGGIPIGYEVFAGNTYEGHTLQEALTRVKGRYQVQQITVVADAGLLNQANVAALEAADCPYIMGYRLKSAGNKMKSQVLDRSRYQPLPAADGKDVHASYQVIEQAGRRIVVTWSEKRAHKDARQRAQGIEKLMKKLKRSRQPATLTRRQYATFLRFSSGGEARVDETKIKRAAQWDGLHAIVAYGNDEMNVSQLLKQYQQLWEIEHCFRTNKHDLKIRPIFHWVPRRIHAHLAICYMAFCCMQHLRHRMKTVYRSLSAEEVTEELSRLQISLLTRQGTSQRYALPSQTNRVARQIYRCLKLKWRGAPFRVK